MFCFVFFPPTPVLSRNNHFCSFLFLVPLLIISVLLYNLYAIFIWLPVLTEDSLASLLCFISFILQIFDAYIYSPVFLLLI